MMLNVLAEAVSLSEGNTFLSEFCILFYPYSLPQWLYDYI